VGRLRCQRFCGAAGWCMAEELGRRQPTAGSTADREGRFLAPRACLLRSPQVAGATTSESAKKTPGRHGYLPGVYLVNLVAAGTAERAGARQHMLAEIPATSFLPPQPGHGCDGLSPPSA
jgi:hypothetical protein